MADVNEKKINDIYQYIDNFKKIETVKSDLLFRNTESVKNPLISIIITVYKREKCLYEAIDSAINQHDINFEYEILVINDDPQGEFKQLKEYRHLKNIFFYRNTKNIGLYNNLNMGVKLSRGKYIACLHDDDLLYPHYLSEIYNFISNIKPQAKCILPNRDIIGLSGSDGKLRINSQLIIKGLLIVFILIRNVLRKPYKKITLKDGLTYLLSNIYKAPSCGVLFEKSSFIKIGGFNQDFWPVTDYYFFLNFNKNFDIYSLRKKIACYRWIDNLSQQKSIQFSNMEFLRDFFKSVQPIKSINNYYLFFYNEILYAKFLMVNEEHRDELKDLYPELRKHNKGKWFMFKYYNMFYKFIHDII
jgi:glycosyltransferase involved in cell wall biosynthesis